MSIQFIDRPENGIQSRTIDKVKAALFTVMTSVYCSLVVAMPVFADNAAEGAATGTATGTTSVDTSKIISGITTGTQNIWNIIVGIAGPIAAIALAVQVVKLVWGGQRAAEEAKSTVIKIIIATAVVLMAPGIISLIQGWFERAPWEFKYQ